MCSHTIFSPPLPNGRPIWPVLTLPANITPDAALTTLVEKGVSDHYREPDRPDIGQRLAAELSVIAQRGYAPLFLLLADLVRFARTQQLAVSASGSLANSLVAYCLGITTVDPLRYNLLFEHLLTLERINLPAIELDFCDVRRDEVLEYVRQTYDADKVALVATLGALDPSSALAETAKAYSMADAVLTKIIKRLVDKWPPAAQPGHSLPEEVLTELETPEQRTVVSAACTCSATREPCSVARRRPMSVSVHATPVPRPTPTTLFSARSTSDASPSDRSVIAMPISRSPCSRSERARRAR